MTSSRLTTWSDSSELVEQSSTTPVPCRVFKINYSTPTPQPKKGRTLSSFISDWTKDEEKSSALSEARTWLGNTVEISGEGETIKSLRLKRGLSQAQLAELMQTSQPHIARIEKGRDSVTLETLCKLSEHLKADYNSIVHAIKLQESILSREIKS